MLFVIILVVMTADIRSQRDNNNNTWLLANVLLICQFHAYIANYL